jgi:hypothetical protein
MTGKMLRRNSVEIGRNRPSRSIKPFIRLPLLIPQRNSDAEELEIRADVTVSPLRSVASPKKNGKI